MARTFLYAAAALVGAVLAVVLPDRLFPPDLNYRTVSQIGEAFRGVLLGSFRFVIGAFAGLAFVAGVSSIGGGGARRPVALVVTSLLAVAVVGVSGAAIHGPTFFPRNGTLEERHRWAALRLARPYVEAVAWAAAAPAVREAFGEGLRFGPARDARNLVYVASSEWRTSLTLDVEGEKGRGRLVLESSLPFSPKDARPAVGPAVLETGGARVPLDSAGNAIGRPGGAGP